MLRSILNGAKRFGHAVAQTFNPNPGEQRLPDEVLRPSKERGIAFLEDPANAQLRPVVRCEDNHTIFGMNQDGDRLLDAMRKPGSGEDIPAESLVYSAFRHAIIPTLPLVRADATDLPPRDGRYAAIADQRSGFFDDSGNVVFALSGKLTAQP